jgi:pimeloyl-ACP methyl ester carboxylesterase
MTGPGGRSKRPVTFLLIAGAGCGAWHWHLVVPELQRRGHEAIAVDLPCDDDSAELSDYVDAAVAAVGDRSDLIVVAQSLGAFTATLLCTRVPVKLLVLVAAMVPAPGESPGDWWENTGWAEARQAEVERLGGDDSLEATFLHDVPPELAAESGNHVRDQSGTPFEKRWPLDAWPEVETRFLLCRDDRFFPAEFQRRVVRERLGIVPDEMDGGHVPMLARPVELAERLDAYARQAGGNHGAQPVV